jgi:hypothetical protein
MALERWSEDEEERGNLEEEEDTEELEGLGEGGARGPEPRRSIVARRRIKSPHSNV